MANTDFVTQFYNLQGDLISERKRNFYKLLKAQPFQLLEEELNHICPRTYLEKLFQVDIFIYFKQYSKLVEVIKGGNEVFISKILKHPEILKETIGNTSAVDFVNEFLPCTSFSLRMKILKKISYCVDESRMDDIVSCVHKRYGLNIAVQLLHTCSSNMIKNVLSEHNVQLKPRQIKFILDKDPELITIYLEHYKSLTGIIFQDTNVCRYIALKNPKLWTQLIKNRLIAAARLGRKTTRNYVRNDNTDIIDNIKYYTDFLKFDALVRNLRGSFPQIYLKLFPKDLNKLTANNISHRLLKCYPRKSQWNLFEQTFMKVFGIAILDNLIYLNRSFIKTFPNKAVLNNWGEVQYNKDYLNYFLKYCVPSKTIPLIKEKINVTSNINERSKLIEILLQNCLVNEDLSSLKDVLKYICTRHKNEDTIRDIIGQIKFFKLDNLNEIHWAYINEILRYVILKTNCCYNYQDLALNYINYLSLHGKPYKQELLTFIENCNYMGYHVQVEAYLKDLKVGKQLWIDIISLYPETTQKKEVVNTYEGLILKIIRFNDSNPKHAIDLSIVPEFVKCITSILYKEVEHMNNSEKEILVKVIEYNVKHPENPIVSIEEARILKVFEYDLNEFCNVSTLYKIVAKYNRSQFENAILLLFWDNITKYSQINQISNLLQWFFLNDPKIIIPVVDKIVLACPEFFCTANVKLMSHLDIDAIIRNYCTSKLQIVDEYLEQAVGDYVPSDKRKQLDIDSRIIEILSKVTSTKDFIEIIEKRFIPNKEKIDTQDEVLRKIYSLQCAVVISLKNLQELPDALPTLMKFCLGDYLQHSLPSLYSICSRTPEKILPCYIDILLKRPVSVRKHAIFLTCELMPYDYVLDKLQSANHSNVSSEKHVVSSTLKFFQKNPSEELLDLLISKFDKVDRNDDETFNTLVNLQIPKKYMQHYVQKCWYFFEGMRTKDVKVQNFLCLLLKHFINLHNRVAWPTVFIRHIVSHYFVDVPIEDHCLDSINTFVCQSLRNKTEQIDNFKIVFNEVLLFKNNKSTKFIKDFFNTFYNIGLDDLKLNTKIDVDNNYYIQLFKDNWFNIFKPTEMFDEYVLLNLLCLRCRTNDNFIESYAQEVNVFFETLVNKYSPYIYSKLKYILLNKLSLLKKEQCLFFYNMLKSSDSDLNCRLALDYLRDTSCDNDITDIYNSIKEILKKSNRPVITLYYNSFFGLE